MICRNATQAVQTPRSVQFLTLTIQRTFVAGVLFIENKLPLTEVRRSTIETFNVAIKSLTVCL